MKEYVFNVTLKFSQSGIEAENLQEAFDKLVETFKEEYNIEPYPSEVEVYVDNEPFPRSVDLLLELEGDE